MPTNQSFDSAIKNRRKLPRRMVKRINIDLTNNKHGGVQVAMTHADNMETTSNSSYGKVFTLSELTSYDVCCQLCF